MQKRFVKAVGLHNIFNELNSSTLDLSSIKNDVSTSVNNESIVFLTADSSDASFGYDVSTKYIWAQNDIYASVGDGLKTETVQEVQDTSYYITPQTIIVDKTSDVNNSFNIEPNKMYMFGTRNTLTITFAPGDPSILNEYMFQFTSGTVATNLTMPNTIIWSGDHTIKNNKKYLVSVENNLGMIGEWDNV